MSKISFIFELTKYLKLMLSTKIKADYLKSFSKLNEIGLSTAKKLQSADGEYLRFVVNKRTFGFVKFDNLDYVENNLEWDNSRPTLTFQKDKASYNVYMPVKSLNNQLALF